MLLMNGSTLEQRSHLSAHPLRLEFRIGTQIITLGSQPEVGDTAYVHLKSDGKTAESLWVTKNPHASMGQIFKAHLDIPPKSLLVATVVNVHKVTPSIYSIVLKYSSDSGTPEHYIHYFGVDGYSEEVHVDTTDNVISTGTVISDMAADIAA
jgi:hypothetical protein